MDEDCDYRADLYEDGTIDYIVDLRPQPPAPAYAWWITKNFLAKGKSFHRKNWFARRLSMEDLRTFREAGLLPDDHPLAVFLLLE